MTTPLDLKAPGIVTSGLALHGVDTVFTVETKTANPSDGSVSITSVQHTVKGTPFYQAKDVYRAGEVIQDGMTMVLIAGENVPFSPALGLKVQQNAGPTYVVLQVIPHSTGTKVAAYELVLREQ